MREAPATILNFLLEIPDQLNDMLSSISYEDSETLTATFEKECEDYIEVAVVSFDKGKPYDTEFYCIDGISKINKVSFEFSSEIIQLLNEVNDYFR